jgi:hypothetical protein
LHRLTLLGPLAPPHPPLPRSSCITLPGPHLTFTGPPTAPPLSLVILRPLGCLVSSRCLTPPTWSVSPHLDRDDEEDNDCDNDKHEDDDEHEDNDRDCGEEEDDHDCDHNEDESNCN